MKTFMLNLTTLNSLTSLYQSGLKKKWLQVLRLPDFSNRNPLFFGPLLSQMCLKELIDSKEPE